MPKKQQDFEWRKYISDYSKFWSWGKLKDSCEIGVLGFLFENINDEEYFQKFFEDKYQVTDMEQIKIFGEKLRKKAKRRNDVAHCGNYLEYEDVCEDKGTVYVAVKEYPRSGSICTSFLMPRSLHENVVVFGIFY